MGHRNLVSYVHVGCILMESHDGNAIDIGRAKTLGPSLCSRGVFHGALRPGKVSTYTLAPYPSTEDSSPQPYVDWTPDLHKSRSLWSGTLFVSTLPSMIVIGLQGSQTPRHEPTPESFVFGPRRSLRLHFPHRLQRPPWAKTSISLHSLTECRPVGPLAPRFVEQSSMSTIQHAHGPPPHEGEWVT